MDAGTRRLEGRRLGDGLRLPEVDTPRLFSIVAMMLVFGLNHFLSAARQPPITLSLIVNMPGRTGYCFWNCLSTCGLTGRKPFWPNTAARAPTS